MAFVMAPLTITPAYKIVHNGRTSQVTIPNAVRMPRNLPNTTYWRCSATATDTSLVNILLFSLQIVTEHFVVHFLDHDD